MIETTTVSAEAGKQVLNVKVKEKVCKPYCLTNVDQPSVEVDYAVRSTKLVKDILYVSVLVNVNASYHPKGCGPCGTKSLKYSEFISVAFTGVTTTNVELTPEEGIVEPAYLRCNGEACGFAATNVLTIKVL